MKSIENTKQSVILDDRYRVEEAIGSGGVGTVFRGTQLSVGRPVAVKLLNSSLSHEPESLARFDLEAKALARLNHQGCVTLFDFGRDEALDAYYIVMEYVEGKTFGQAKEDGMSIKDGLGVLIDVCHALAHAHSQGITHRDLKPSNIMILDDRSQGAKVLDFGLARLYQETLQGERLSVSGRIYGTPAYMSPEQCQGELGVGPAADIYALGVMLYEVLESRLPFEAHSVTGLLLMHIQEDLPPLQNDKVSEQLRALCMQMTQKDPNDRCLDLALIVEVLEQERRHLEGLASSPQHHPHTLPQYSFSPETISQRVEYDAQNHDTKVDELPKGLAKDGWHRSRRAETPTPFLKLGAFLVLMFLGVGAIAASPSEKSMGIGDVPKVHLGPGRVIDFTEVEVQAVHMTPVLKEKEPSGAEQELRLVKKSPKPAKRSPRSAKKVATSFEPSSQPSRRSSITTPRAKTLSLH